MSYQKDAPSLKPYHHPLIYPSPFVYFICCDLNFGQKTMEELGDGRLNDKKGEHGPGAMDQLANSLPSSVRIPMSTGLCPSCSTSPLAP